MTVVAWALAAQAAEPLVHTGDAEDAIARAAAATRLPAADFAPATVESLRSGAVTVGSGGTVTPCGGPAITREQLLLAVQGAEGAQNYGESERARAELARVADADRCAAWDAELLARYFALRAQVDEDPTVAFARARRLDPSLAWREEWDPSRRAAFDAAAPGAPVTLAVPLPQVQLDGAAVTGKVQVLPGWHRVVAPGFDGALELEADGTLLVPSQVPATAFDSLETEVDRAIPTTLLAATFGEGARVFVANDRGVWAATAGRVDWLALERQRKHPLVWAGLVTALTGAAATAGTSVWTLSARADAAPLVSALEGADAATLSRDLGAAQDAADRFRLARTVTVGAGALGGVGLGLLGVGFALGPQTVSGGAP